MAVARMVTRASSWKRRNSRHHMSGNVPTDPKRAARRAGLRYMPYTVPGISRHGRPGHFTYVMPSGKRVRDATVLKRIAKMAIPPAWKKVWIAPLANAHLAATGRDARGRKQYRYHPGFTALRDQDKYAHLVAFAESLPAIRRRVARDLKSRGRARILAVIVLLLQETLIRVGNEDYARTNHSFGLTTLRNQHAWVKGEDVVFMFR